MKVKGIEVTVEQRGNCLHFSVEGNRGRAIWNLTDKKWMPVKGEVGSKFKVALKKAFDL